MTPPQVSRTLPCNEFELKEVPRLPYSRSSVEHIEVESDSSEPTYTPPQSDIEVEGPQVVRKKKTAPHPDKKTWSQPEVLRDKAYEIFCGAAGLTLNLTKAGFNATGVDHKSNKDKPKGRCLWIDLSTRRGQEQMRRLALDISLLYC